MPGPVSLTSYLSKLVAIALECRTGLCRLDFELHAKMLALRTQELRDFLQQAGHRDRHANELARTNEVEQLAQRSIESIDLRQRDALGFFAAGLHGHANRGEWIAQLVRQTPGEPTERGEPLAVPHRPGHLDKRLLEHPQFARRPWSGVEFVGPRAIRFDRTGESLHGPDDGARDRVAEERGAGQTQCRCGQNGLEEVPAPRLDARDRHEDLELLGPASNGPHDAPKTIGRAIQRRLRTQREFDAEQAGHGVENGRALLRGHAQSIDRLRDPIGLLLQFAVDAILRLPHAGDGQQPEENGDQQQQRQDDASRQPGVPNPEGTVPATQHSPHSGIAPVLPVGTGYLSEMISMRFTITVKWPVPLSRSRMPVMPTRLPRNWCRLYAGAIRK